MNTQNIMDYKSIKSDPVVFVSLKYKAQPTVEGKHYPSAEIIPNIDQIAERQPDGSFVNRVIRYVPGETSIYADEQTKDVKFKPQTIKIPGNGIMIVRPEEATLLEFLRKSNYNQENPYRMPGKNPLFREVNKEKAAEDFLEKEREEINIRHKVLNLNAAEVEAYALALRMRGVANKMTDEIRRDLLVIAKQNPEKFMTGLSDVNMKRAYHIMKGIEDGVIILNRRANSITWTQGNPIITAPIGVDPVDYLIKFIDSEDGQIVYAELKRRLRLEIDVTEEVKEEPKKKTISEVSTQELIQLATDEKILYNAGPWYKIKDGSAKGLTLTKNFEELYQMIDKNKDLGDGTRVKDAIIKAMS